MFGKALGNGYAITAIIGRREIMEEAQSTFISSTFWTERIGPAAALKTLEVMEKVRSWEQITTYGKRIKELWRRLAEEHNLTIQQFGLPALCCFNFESKDSQAYKTLITQEMLKAGILAGNSVYVSTAHDGQMLERYGEELNKIFGLISECEAGRDIKTLLQGPICHSGTS